MKKSFLRSTLLAASIAALFSQAHAAGLGRINVFSALGQPLRAEVEVSATPEELEAMSARLASVEAHTRANIEFASELSAIRMSIERRASGGAVVKISSDRPFNEPFVDMLVELSWNGGRILREYTFLLDPVDTSGARPLPQISEPVIRSTPAPVIQPPPVVSPAPPAPAAAPAPAPRRVEAAPAAPRPVAPAASAPARAETPEGDYTVKSGDTASSIAARLKPVEVTRDQMIAALYQANRDVFTGGNINRLATGKVLRVPSAGEAAAIDKAEARQIIVKASSFDSLKQEVATSVAQGPARAPSAAQSASGRIAPSVQDTPAATSQARDQLTIGRTAAEAAGADARSANRIKSLEADLLARDKALAESRSRAADLERNVKELEKLVQMKTDSLAALQKQAVAAEAKAKEAAALAAQRANKEEMAAAAAAEKAAKAAAAAAEKAAKEAAAAAEKAAREQAAAAEKAAKEAADQAAKDEAARLQAEAEAAARAAAEAQAAASEPEVAASSEAVAEVVPESEPQAAPAPAPAAPADTAVVVEEQGSLLTNPLTLGGLLVALGGAGFVVMRNRRRNAASGAMTTSLSESSTSPNSVFGNAGGQTVDTGTSMLHTDFSQSGLSAIDTDEGVDPVAEADVYMAYGRDAQAEEILQDALKNDPSRLAIYLKLLEIYAQRRSVKQFESVATDLYTQTGGLGDEWAKAAALGARLDPGNPLYGNGGSPAAQPGSDTTTVVIPAATAAAVAAAAATPAEIELPDLSPEEPAAVSFGTNNASEMRATWTVPGEIGQLAQGGPGGDLPVVPEPVPAAQVSTSPDPLNLDFNLDLELPEGDEPETRMEAREEDDEPLSIDTQPDFETSDAAPLEFDLDVEPSPAMAPAPVAVGEAAVDEAMSVLSATDADMGIERALERSHLSEVDLEKTNFESSLLDFDFELGEDSNVSRSNMDLGNLHLDTGSRAQPQAEMVDTGAASTPASGNIDLNDEVSTKLELARAYEEMGDIEGARELLEEVMSDGADSQKEMARTILTRIT